MMVTTQIRSMEDTLKNLETLQLEVIIKEIIQKVFRNVLSINLIVTKTDNKIDNRIAIKTASTTPSLCTKEEKINMQSKNRNIVLKTTIPTRDKEGMIQVSQMKKAKCLMKAIECLKINHRETLMITKEMSKIVDQEILRKDKGTSTISKVLLMLLTKRITMIAQTTKKM